VTLQFDGEMFVFRVSLFNLNSTFMQHGAIQNCDSLGMRAQGCFPER
jgi:hypothetical protein